MAALQRTLVLLQLISEMSLDLSWGLFSDTRTMFSFFPQGSSCVWDKGGEISNCPLFPHLENGFPVHWNSRSESFCIRPASFQRGTNCAQGDHDLCGIGIVIPARPLLQQHKREKKIIGPKVFSFYWPKIHQIRINPSIPSFDLLRESILYLSFAIGEFPQYVW